MRWLLLAMMFSIIVMSVAMNDVSSFFIRLTFWGIIFATFQVIATIRAANHYKWQVLACKSVQLSVAVNISITIIYWTVVAPYIFPRMTGDSATKERLKETIQHTVPLLATVLNVVISELRLVAEDWVDAVLVGVVYTVVNGMATVVRGESVYPIVDWNNLLFTLCQFWMLITTLALTYVGAAYVVNRR